MLSRVCSAALNGIDAYAVEVEVNCGHGDTLIAITVSITPMKIKTNASDINSTGNFNLINKLPAKRCHLTIDKKRNIHNDYIMDKYCFSYIRFSSSKQAAGDSLRRQMEIAPRVAREKGWILRDDLCITNPALSAYKGMNIAAIESIIKAAQDGKIPEGTVMILEALDRAWRTEIDIAFEMFRRLLKAGIEIYIDKSGRHITKADLANPMSLMLTIVELDAGFQYSAKLSDRVGKAWRQKKARAADGVVMSTMIPAWLDADRVNNKITPNEKAAIVKRIFTSYANGKGIRTIMRELNADKIAPFGKGKQNKDGCWSSTHIRRTLTSRTVLGEYQPCRYQGRKRNPEGEPVTDYYPAIIEPALFYKVQEKLARKQVNAKTGKLTHGHVSGPKGNATNLFTGLAKCFCGAAMHIKKNGGKYPYSSLVCANALRGNGCKYHTLQVQYVERAVLTLLFSKVVPAMTETDNRQEKLTTLNGELKETQRQKGKWVEIIDQSETVPAVAAQKLNALETRESALQRQIESLSATIDDNPLTAWQQVPNTPENRLKLQTILADEIESLTIDAGNKKAALVMKDPYCTFNFSWPDSTGTNANKENPANSYFNCEGEGLNKRFEYLDRMLVWKSDENIPVEMALNCFVPDAEAVASI